MASAKGTSKARPVVAGGAREGDRRRTILRAAIEVFATKGYHGCRIADVAREAKVAYGLVYHYFHNKDALLQSVFETGWGTFVGQLEEVSQQGLGLEAMVRAITSAAFEAYRVDPRAVRVLILEIGRSPAGGRVSRDTAFAELMRLLSGMFAEAQERGELTPGADPVLCAALLFGAIEMGLTALVVGLLDRAGPSALDRAKEQVAEAFLHGVLLDTSEEVAWKKDRSGIRPRAARRS